MRTSSSTLQVAAATFLCTIACLWALTQYGYSFLGDSNAVLSGKHWLLPVSHQGVARYSQQQREDCTSLHNTRSRTLCLLTQGKLDQLSALHPSSYTSSSTVATTSHPSGSAFVVLAGQTVDSSTLDFAKQLTPHYWVYIVVDGNDEDLQQKHAGLNITFVQHDRSSCYLAGYTQSSWSNHDKFGVLLNAWDKALLHMTQIATQHDHVWFVEDDVFIPAVTTTLSIDQQYPDTDFLAPNLGSWGPGPDSMQWGHWYALADMDYPQPWKSSGAQGTRMSRALLDGIAGMASTYGHLAYVEVMLPTVAAYHNLTIEVPKQLQTQVCCNGGWTWEMMVEEGFDHVFHPVKNKSVHAVHRADIEQYNKQQVVKKSKK